MGDYHLIVKRLFFAHAYPLQLYRSRLAVVQGEDDLKNHKALFRKFTAMHVSSDESDYTNAARPVFKRVSPAWRSTAFQNFLWHLDGIALARKMKPANWKQGRGPRFRPRTSKVNHAAEPPLGLPKNCYDSEWWNSMRPFQQRLINAQIDHDFTLPDQYNGL